MNKPTHKLSCFLKRFLILIPSIILFLFFIHYSNSIKFYGDFTIEFSSITKDTNNIDSYAYEVYGISYFNDTFPLVEIKNHYQSDSSQFFKKLCTRANYVQNQKIITTYNNETLNIKAIDSIYNYKDNLFADCKAPNLFKKVKTIKVLLLFFVLVLVSLFCSMIFVFKYEAIRSRLNSNPKIKKYIIVIGIIFILILGLLIFHKIFEINKYHNFNSSDTKIEYDSIGINLPNDLTKHTIRIQDTTGNGLNFNFQLNDKFWFTENRFKDYISNKIDVEESFGTNKDIIKIWEFVSKYSVKKYPDTIWFDNEILDKPNIFINSTGFGICGNSANATAQFANILGYSARLVSIEGTHTFAEIYDGFRWVMLDADYGLLFVDSSQTIISYKELIHSKGKNIEPIKYSHCKTIKNYQNLMTTYPKSLPDIYFSNSLYSYFVIKNKNFTEHIFKLPPNSTVEFPIYYEKFKTYLLKIYIPDKYCGNINIPLAIAKIKNNKYLTTNSLCKKGKLYNKFFICGDDIEIYAFINPLCFDNDKVLQNILSVFTYNNTIPKITTFPNINSTDFSKSINPDLEILINIHKEDYIIKAENYLKTLDKKIETMDDILHIFKTHYSSEGYVKKEKEINTIALNSIHYRELNNPENLALILIIMDHFGLKRFIESDFLTICL